MVTSLDMMKYNLHGSTALRWKRLSYARMNSSWHWYQSLPACFRPYRDLLSLACVMPSSLANPMGISIQMENLRGEFKNAVFTSTW
jgi:hypothetical protein